MEINTRDFSRKISVMVKEYSIIQMAIITMEIGLKIIVKVMEC
jgi:hypothetical protein